MSREGGKDKEMQHMEQKTQHQQREGERDVKSPGRAKPHKGKTPRNETKEKLVGKDSKKKKSLPVE